MNGSNLNRDDVVNIQFNMSFAGSPTFTVAEAASKIAALIGEKNNLNGEICRQWREGISCRVLREGKVWTKGKVRISLDFIPDEPEVNKSVPTSTDAVIGGEHRTNQLS